MKPSRFNFRIWEKPKNNFKGCMLSINFYWFEENFIRSIEDIPEDVVLMQSTGMADENGKEVFEGDILKIPAHYFGDLWVKEHTEFVYWDHMCGSLDGPGFFVGDAVTYDMCEIIGNIYENPELKENCGEK